MPKKRKQVVWEATEWKHSPSIKEVIALDVELAFNKAAAQAWTDYLSAITPAVGASEIDEMIKAQAWKAYGEALVQARRVRASALYHQACPETPHQTDIDLIKRIAGAR